jgi:hypothetical protein
MKKIIRLTESDLTRIVKRVIKETEEGSQDTKCKSKMEADEVKQKLYKKGLDGFEFVGTKSMYPKTYAKLKSYGNEFIAGCVELEGEGLVFYEDYNGWLVLFNKFCGDRIVKIPKVSKKIQNYMKTEPGFISWVIMGDSIYLASWEGC